MGKQGRRTIRLGDWRGENKQPPNMWKALWRKLRREKRKILELSQRTNSFYSSGPKLIPYDPLSYSQNFDQSTAGEELDNLSRSFSARFALADVASTIFLHQQHLQWSYKGLRLGFCLYTDYYQLSFPSLCSTEINLWFFHLLTQQYSFLLFFHILVVYDLPTFNLTYSFELMF